MQATDTPPGLDAPSLPAPREVELDPDSGVPPVTERLLGVLLAPRETFSALEASWGWLAPWGLTAAAGLAAGLLRLSLVDVKAVEATRQERAISLLDEEQRRLFAQIPDDKRELMAKGMTFVARIREVSGPTLGALIAIVVVGLFLFLGSQVLGNKSSPVKAIVVAAHAKLVAVVGYWVVAVATILGNPAARTDARHLVDDVQHPFLGGLLSGLDPISLWHTVLLALGLVHALGVPPRRALACAAVFHVLVWLLSASSGG